MTTTNTEQTTGVHDAHKPWYERIVDSSGGSRTKRLTPLIVVAAIVAIVAVFVWQSNAASNASEVDSRSDLMARGLKLLPDDPSWMAKSQSYYRLSSLAPLYYQDSDRDQNRRLRSGIRTDAAGAAEYVDRVETVLDDFEDRQGEFQGTPEAWMFWNTKQQLHWFAALNSTDPAKKASHLQAQLSSLGHARKNFSSNPLLALHSKVTDPDKDVLDNWQALAEKELAFTESQGAGGTISPDENLSAAIELENGAVLELEFYSQVAPKTVANFLSLSTAGFYNNTAFHSIDATTGTLTGGGALSRILGAKEAQADQRRPVWHMSDTGYSLPREANPLMDVNRGALTTEMVGGGCHGSHFTFHTQDPEEPTPNYSHTVFARVTKGLEALDELLKTETIDDPESENSLMPKVPLKIKTITISGNIQHPSRDSWKPIQREQEIPEQTAEEKRLQEDADKANSEKSAEPGDDGKDK